MARVESPYWSVSTIVIKIFQIIFWIINGQPHRDICDILAYMTKYSKIFFYVTSNSTFLWGKCKAFCPHKFRLVWWILQTIEQWLQRYQRFFSNGIRISGLQICFGTIWNLNYQSSPVTVFICHDLVLLTEEDLFCIHFHYIGHSFTYIHIHHFSVITNYFVFHSIPWIRDCFFNVLRHING